MEKNCLIYYQGKEDQFDIYTDQLAELGFEHQTSYKLQLLENRLHLYKYSGACFEKDRSRAQSLDQKIIIETDHCIDALLSSSPGNDKDDSKHEDQSKY